MKGKYEVIYSSLVSEAESARNWPIRLLSFVSLLYVAISSAHFNDEALALLNNSKIECSLILLAIIIYTWLAYLLGKYHLQYLKYRNQQIVLNKLIDSEQNLLPNDWKTELKVSLLTRWQGWSFYLFYLTIISIATVVVICKL